MQYRNKKYGYNFYGQVYNAFHGQDDIYVNVPTQWNND